MSNRDPYSNVPVETRGEELENLEPHEQTIERLAAVYFGTCDRVARAVRTIKSRLRGSDDE